MSVAMIALPGPTPVARARDAAAPVRVALASVDSPLGPLRIAAANGAICALDYADFDDRMHALLRQRFGIYVVDPERDPLGAAARLERYFSGDLNAFDSLPISGGGTAYQQRVWSALRAIPAGSTRSYGQVAALLGATHPRAIGHANALNPIAIVVPCHRVIGADRSLTGYAGGIARKRWLLDHEARFAGSAPTLALGLGADAPRGR